MNRNDISPGPQLYIQVRAAFVAQGTTLGAWCRERGIAHQNAKSALVGAWNGPKGREVRRKLIEASGVARPSKIPA